MKGCKITVFPRRMYFFRVPSPSPNTTTPKSPLSSVCWRRTSARSPSKFAAPCCHPLPADKIILGILDAGVIFSVILFQSQGAVTCAHGSDDGMDIRRQPASRWCRKPASAPVNNRCSHQKRRRCAPAWRGRAWNVRFPICRWLAAKAPVRWTMPLVKCPEACEALSSAMQTCTQLLSSHFLVNFILLLFVVEVKRVFKIKIKKVVKY